jgi:pimeloyl-ACP methyl ester carboxylesterase
MQITPGVTSQRETAPGRVVGWETIGAGPDLVMLHGAGRARQHLRELATVLGGDYRVHLVDRNGRGLSLARDDAAGFAGQASDVVAVLEATGSRLLFGHSAGGAVALEVARQRNLERLALYEPGISVDGSFPPELAAALRRGLRSGDLGRAQTDLAFGVGALPAWFPKGPARALFRLLLASKAGAELRGLLPLVLPDLEAILAGDGPVSRFSGIETRTLVLWGARSPAYLTEAARALAAALPHGEGQEIAGQGHNAPDLTGVAQVGERLRTFFGGS